MKKTFRSIVELFKLEVDPFKPVDDSGRTDINTRANKQQKEEIVRRLDNRFGWRGVSSGNTQVANAFIFGGEVTLATALGAAIFSTNTRWVPLLLLPSLLLAIASLGLLGWGIYRARAMGKPSHIDDEYVEVGKQVLANDDNAEGKEIANRSDKQRSRLHVNDLYGNRSMVVFLLALGVLALEVTVYCFLVAFV